MTRLLEAVRAWWRRGIAAITAGARRLYRAAIHAARRIRRRWTADHSFRRTISTAITALSTTAIPSPTVSAAVSAYLNERPRRLAAFPDHDEDEDDEDEDYPGWGDRSQRLWDRLD